MCTKVQGNLTSVFNRILKTYSHEVVRSKGKKAINSQDLLKTNVIYLGSNKING